jgi:DNA-binding NarL/FixJ family response regulator
MAETRMEETDEDARIPLVMVEDDPDLSQTVQDFVRQSPDIELLGAASNEAGFKALVEKHVPSMALIDIELDTKRSGLNLLEWLRAEYPVTRPVIMTVNRDDVLEAYNRGARGYVLKTELQIIVPTLLDVHRGKMVIPPNVGELFVQQVAAQQALFRKSMEMERFSDREKEILRMLKAKVHREKIADQLHISFYTVRRHIQNILEKSGEETMKALLDKYGKLLDK